MRVRWTLLVLAMLVVFAVLQYYWLDEVSRAERLRMDDLLSQSLNGFTSDFDRELTLIALSFFRAVDEVEDDEAALAGAYESWQKQARWPGLIAGLYLVSAGRDTFTPARGLDMETGQFTEMALPDELSHLGGHKPPGRRRVFTEYMGVKPPFFGVPLLGAPTREQDRNRGRRRRSVPRPEGVALVLLDETCLRQKVFPDLGQKHFSGIYSLSVNNAREKQHKIYGPAQDESVLPAGEAVPFFGFRAIPELAEYAFSSRKGKLRGRPGLATPGPRMLAAFAGDNEAGKRGLWLLTATHKGGSLEDVVAAARLRNMALGFGVLVILGVSTVLMAVSTQRARGLALRQLEFVAGISHELMTPLAGLHSAGQNLADGVVPDGEPVRRYGRLVETETRRLSAMVEQVLEYAGIQGGQKYSAREPVAFADLIEEGLADCETVLVGSKFTVERDISKDLPRVAADRAAFTRVVRNLVGNAVKYASKGAWLGVTASSSANRREVVVRFADKGPGIDQRDRAHIFEPFYRGREVVASPVHGSGLGLCLVRHIVHEHGGRIEFEKVAQGSVFAVTLPTLQDGVS